MTKIEPGTPAKRIFGGSIHSALIHAATAYDRRRAGKPGYNHYALPQYFGRIDQVEADIAKGATVRAALLAGFSDRLLDAMLVAVGEPKFTREERDRGHSYYHPAA